MKKLNISFDTLHQLYVVDQKTIKDIASIIGCCTATISKYLREYKIPIRTTKPWTAELNHHIKKKNNVYDLSGDFGIGYTFNTYSLFYFDLEDYDKIKDICWHETSEGYLCGRDLNGGLIKIHQLILGIKHIDHKNHNKLDNRKDNLRPSNDLLNSMNRSTPINNRSGCKGVCWRSREKKWRAYITHLGKRIELGLYDDLEEACLKRKEAENRLYGEWSYYNSIKKEEII